MMRWYVVHTQPRAEVRALWHLQNQEFRCFLPKFATLRRHARKVEPVNAPLFPRYLFVAFDLSEVTLAVDQWDARRGWSCLSDGARPIPGARRCSREVDGAV